MFRILFLTLILVVSATANAQIVKSAGEGLVPETRALFVGERPDDNAPGILPEGLQVFSIPSLPSEAEARQNALATLLRATPVSTLISDPATRAGRDDQFFLVIDMALSVAAGDARIAVGDTEFALAELPGRLSAIVDAFDPSLRAIAFLSISDPDDQFPAMMTPIRKALDAAQFQMVVAVIRAGADNAACTMPAQIAPHYAVIGGVADQGQFGDGDGHSNAGEIGLYLNRALGRMASREAGCPLVYSLIVRADDDPARVLAVHSDETAFGDLDSRLYHETFESKFLLQSDEEALLAGYLESCEFCPNERALSERLAAMREVARTGKLEAEIWAVIRDDDNPERIEIYLADCAVCDYRAEAEERLKILNVAAEARGAEALRFRDAAASRQLTDLKAYLADCIACEFRAEADALIEDIEADKAYASEQAAFRAALAASDEGAIAAYLSTCRLCAHRAAGEQALARLSRRDDVSAECVRLAGMPQFGGPRRLQDIDIAAARQECGKALDEFPGDALLTVLLGRIDQADGKFAAARVAYDKGLEAGHPVALGLSAYLNYSGADGVEADTALAERQAVEGAEAGDWLSRELLTVLYSRDMIAGKGPKDAFTIALALAEEGNQVAQFFAGYFYLTGTGTEAHERNAELWLSRAAAEGYMHASSYLAGLYETGSEAIYSEEKAAAIYLAALEAGDKTALDRMTAQLRERKRGVIRLVQERLKEAGVYRGKIDGLPGPGTVEAVQKFVEGAHAG
ncbi:MAG: hypothetical protein K8F59_11930 [Rhodobacteraceae bacterium]|nr:hypothetical protein [Paracoccaceae bacterium]